MERYNISTVAEYNNRQTEKWKIYARESGHYNSLAGFVFLDNKGNYRKNGYVGEKGRAALWSKTKKELRERLDAYQVVTTPSKD